jgi:hypothetical protein
MKPSLLLLVVTSFLMLFTSLVTAQSTIPNGTFESWANGSPVGWFALNNIPGLATPVSQSSVAHGGSSAARGEVIQFVTGANLVPVLQSGTGAQGFAFNQRPGSLTGYYQFTPAASSGDRFLVNVILLKGTIAGLVVATGAVTITNAATSYTQLSIPLVYTSPSAPDTAYIQILVAGPGSAQPKVGTFYLIDDLAFSGTASAVRDDAALPQSFALDQNYPNPFNPSTSIRFSVAQPGHVSLKVYNVLGAEVALLVNEQKDAGTFSVNWNAAGLPSGMYLYRMSVTSEKGQVFEAARKLVLVK